MGRAASHRWVCGAMGLIDPVEYERLRVAIGAPPEPVVRTADAVLHARDPGSLMAWSGPGARGWCWGAPVGAGRVMSVLSALEEPTGAGLAIDEAGPVLHTDSAGVIPLFTYVGDTYLLFCSSVDALARSVSRPLHVNWDAWSELLCSMVLLTQSTPFEEIDRLPPGAVRRWRGRRVVIDDPSWSLAERSADVATDLSPSDVAEALRAAVARIDADDLVVPLSGGWDSRLLAALASARESPPRAVTVENEFGRDQEARLAAAAADALGLEHSYLPTGSWASSSRSMALRLDHLTSLHHWLEPVLGWIGEREVGAVLDGLAGDVLLKRTYSEDEPDHRSDDELARILQRFTVGGRPDGLLEPRFAARAWDHVEGALRREYGRWRGHPAARNLLVYRARTLGGVSLAPTMALASVAPVVMPFTHPAVAQLSLSLPAAKKQNGAMYAQVLARIHPAVASLPSTNDTTSKAIGRVRPDLTREAVGAFHELLSAPSIQPLLGPELRSTMATGSLRAIIATARGRRVTHGLALLSRWLDRYSGVLADTGVPAPRVTSPRAATDVAVQRLPASVASTSELVHDDWLLGQASGATLVLVLFTAGAGANSDLCVHAGTVAVNGDPSEGMADGVQDLQDLQQVRSVVGSSTTVLLESRLSAASIVEILDRLAPPLRRGTRLAISLPLLGPDGGTDGTGFEQVGLLAGCLDLFHVEGTRQYLRLVGRFSPGRMPSWDPPLTAAVLSVLGTNLEERARYERRRRDEAKRAARRDDEQRAAHLESLPAEITKLREELGEERRRHANAAADQKRALARLEQLQQHWCFRLRRWRMRTWRWPKGGSRG